MPLDFGPSGFLGALGQGLRGAGGVLSKDVYDTQSEEGRLLATLQNRTAMLQQQSIIQGVENGSIDPRDPQVQQVLQRMGMPAMQPNAHVQQRQDALEADRKFGQIVGSSEGLRGSTLRNSADLLKTLEQVPVDVLARSPNAQQTLKLAGTLQDKEAQQEQRKQNYELRVDALEQRREEREREANRKEAADADRAEARRDANNIKFQIAQLHDAARREGLAGRIDQKKAAADAKLEKETAPVSDLVNEIDKAIRMIDENPGVAGARGMLTRGKEFVQSTVSPGTPTPGSDFQAQLLEVQSRWKKLPTVAANRFKSDADKIDNTVRGLGTFTSDTQARNSLVRLRDSLASGLENRGVEVPKDEKPDPTRGKLNAIPEAVKAAGWNYEPDVYEYRIQGGQVQRKKKKAE